LQLTIILNYTFSRQVEESVVKKVRNQHILVIML